MDSKELLKALERLSAAALARDASSGDPIHVMETRAELAEANKFAMEVIKKSKPAPKRGRKFVEGGTAYIEFYTGNLKDLPENPYIPGTNDHYEWEIGMEDAYQVINSTGCKYE